MIQTLEENPEERYVVTCNFQGKLFLMSLELRRKFYPLFLSSPTFQVGEDGSDTDWNMTVRLPEGLPEDFDYSEPVNAVGGKKEEENGWGEGGIRGSSPVKEEERRARSPGKEVSIHKNGVTLINTIKRNRICCAYYKYIVLIHVNIRCEVEVQRSSLLLQT